MVVEAGLGGRAFSPIEQNTPLVIRGELTNFGQSTFRQDGYSERWDASRPNVLLVTSCLYALLCSLKPVRLASAVQRRQDHQILCSTLEQASVATQIPHVPQGCVLKRNPRNGCSAFSFRSKQTQHIPVSLIFSLYAPPPPKKKRSA